MLDVKKTLAKLLKCDYVIEEGISGIWTYRKWSSGIAECWGITASATYAQTDTWGQGYYTHTSVNLPSGVFTSVAHASVEKNTSGAGLVWASVDAISTSSVGFYVSDTNSGSRTCGFGISVKGRWK